MFEIKLPWPLASIQFPITEWLPKYTKDLFYSDLTAGLTVFVFLIPQGMAYALLASMPPIYGLYSSIVPLYIYTILGTSRQLAIGPMAITSLLLGVSVQSMGFEEATAEFIRMVLNLSMVVGIITFLLGLFRLGSLANLISNSVLSGFLSASALVIALSQLKWIFGIQMPRFQYSVQTIGYLLTHLDETNLAALTMGIVCWVSLYMIKRWRQNNKPTPERMQSTFFRVAATLAKMVNFITIVFTSAIAYALLESGIGLQIVGQVPSGLQPPSFAPVGFSEALLLIPAAVPIVFVAFAGNWAVAKKYSMEYDYEVSATQELIASGVSITIGVPFNAFAVSGGLARSAVNAESGAMTQVVAVIVASLMILAVQFLTALFYYIPMNVLAAIIEVSVVSMVDFNEMQLAYKHHKKDFAVIVSTFLCTFFVGVSEGLYVGIAMSIAVILHSSSFPHMAHLGKLPDSEGGHYKDVQRFPNAEQFPGVAIVRMDATIFFANCEHFKDTARRAASGEFHTAKDVPIKKLVIDATAWIDLDMQAVKTLFELKKEMSGKGITVVIACAKGVVRDKLRDNQYAGETQQNGTPSIAEALVPGMSSFSSLQKLDSNDDNDEEHGSGGARACDAQKGDAVGDVELAHLTSGQDVARRNSNNSRRNSNAEGQQGASGVVLVRVEYGNETVLRCDESFPEVDLTVLHRGRAGSASGADVTCPASMGAEDDQPIYL